MRMAQENKNALPRQALKSIGQAISCLLAHRVKNTDTSRISFIALYHEEHVFQRNDMFDRGVIDQRIRTAIRLLARYGNEPGNEPYLALSRSISR